jgi:hypothetical protein
MTPPSAAPRPYALLLCLLLLQALAAPAAAAPVDLYAGEAPVAAQDEAERSRALAPALLSALVRASGDPTLATDARLPGVLEQAPRLLQSFGYRQVVETGADSAPVLRDYLQARFDPAGLQGALAALGRGVWSERPRTLVWLVIDDGSTRRIASAAQVAALGALSRTAQQRGIEFVLPAMDAEDLARIDPDTLWGGPSSAALAAASRYGTPVALVARLSRSGTGWSARLTLADGGRPEDWASNFGDANAALAAAANGLADRLAQRFALAAAERVVADYEVTIAGIAGADDYARVMAYLGGLSVVQSFAPRAAEGSTLSIAATLTVAPARLRQVLAIAGVLAFDEGALADERRIALRLVR